MKPINILTYKGDQDKTKKISEKDTSEHNFRVSKTTKQLEELLKAREIQKSRLENLAKQKITNNDIPRKIFYNEDQYNFNKHHNKCIEPLETRMCYAPCDPCISNNPCNIPNTNEESSECNNPIIYVNIWDAYWPFIGSGNIDPSLVLELDYLTFNGTLVEKWNANLPTPPTTMFPIKDLFKFTLQTGPSDFNFDFRFENVPNIGTPTVINITPKSTTYPFLLNQFILIKDPNIMVTNPGVSPTNIEAVLGYYNSTNLYLNEFTGGTDSFNTVKNLFMSTQLFFFHISQIKDEVKLVLLHSTTTGENLFKVIIETNAKVEIKETLIPVLINPLSSGDDMLEVTISQRTIYINDKYFMTYATFINDIASAQQIGISPGYTPDARQTPLQLVVMLLFDPIAPLINLDTIMGITDHERLFVRLYRDVLLKNP
jgi:hypothetical protein